MNVKIDRRHFVLINFEYDRLEKAKKRKKRSKYTTEHIEQDTVKGRR